MSGAKIGANCVIGAGSLVPQGKEIPPKTMALGSPAKVVRELSGEEIKSFGKMAEHYRQRALYIVANGENPDF